MEKVRKVAPLQYLSDQSAGPFLTSQLPLSSPTSVLVKIFLPPPLHSSSGYYSCPLFLRENKKFQLSSSPDQTRSRLNSLSEQNHLFLRLAPKASSPDLLLLQVCLMYFQQLAPPGPSATAHFGKHGSER